MSGVCGGRWALRPRAVPGHSPARASFISDVSMELRGARALCSGARSSALVRYVYFQIFGLKGSLGLTAAAKE